MLSSPLLKPALERPELLPQLRTLGVASDQIAALRFGPRLAGA